MSAFRFALLAMQRRTDVLGGEREPGDDRVLIDTNDPEAVLRHCLSGYVPAAEVDEAMTWAARMANEIISMVVSVEDPEAKKAAVAVAVAQCLGIGAATERSASGKTV